MHQFHAMNTRIVTIGLPESAELETEHWFSLVECSLSRFREDSELSKLNRSEGRPFLATPLLYEVLSAAHQYYVETKGLFNPYMGNQLRTLGYSGSFEQVDGIAPAACTVIPPAPVPARFDAGMQSIVLAKQASVDLGGFAKGWCAHQQSLRLQRDGISSGAIGAGGDIAYWGHPEDAWELGIASPWDSREDLLTLQLRGTMGIATSSTAKRRWSDKAGRVHHHILDPRSGESVKSDLLQATVFAPTLVEAEIYAKCVLILGADAGIRWLTERHPSCAVIAVTPGGSLLSGGSLSHYTMEGEIRLELIS
ncbi:FAD:protein FMN transferase [Paenibacillus sp. GD4]|uniref:FAD:protein FMN transferase n=1 Tax=Paenibacillus sp. GD4 TaxID=3068890 RepID=UPI0027967D8D|nr:FAD:protein FMN transferase [Paenibacillus sp. GD4]MDQ1912034.1 FAD:protein FMN transferase [Paenibacillus sp. GD4]